MKNKKYGEYRHNIKQKLIDMYGQKCYYCDKDKKYKELTFDHIYPKSKLRGDRRQLNIQNCVLSCYSCNLKKGDKIISIEDFRKEIMKDKYYPFNPPKSNVIEVKKNKIKKSKRKDEYAHNVVYPINPIVKRVKIKWYQLLLNKIFNYEV